MKPFYMDNLQEKTCTLNQEADNERYVCLCDFYNSYLKINKHHFLYLLNDSLVKGNFLKV